MQVIRVALSAVNLLGLRRPVLGEDDARHFESAQQVITFRIDKGFFLCSSCSAFSISRYCPPRRLNVRRGGCLVAGLRHRHPDVLGQIRVGVWTAALSLVSFWISIMLSAS